MSRPFGPSARPTLPPSARRRAAALLGLILAILTILVACAKPPIQTRPRPGQRSTPSASSVPAPRSSMPTPGTGEPPTVGPAATAVLSDVATPPTTIAGDLPADVPLPLGDSRFAFVLLGYGGPGHEGAYLTDSIVVVVVDPVQKTLTMLSVPRDAWVPLRFGDSTVTYNKINTAYAFAQDGQLAPDRLARYAGKGGPGVFASDTVARVVGMPITYYLGLDFQGFREMIDAIGGVDVTVPDSFSARYPANDDSDVDASWMTVTFESGPRHFDGERAIEFARARETIDNPDEGNDFARSRRQRLIMEAFKNDLIKPAGLIHLPRLLEIAAGHVDTNYAIPTYAQLAQLALGWKDVRIYQTALTTANYLQEGAGPDGAYVLVPSSPDRSWAQVRAFGRRLLSDPELGVQVAATRIVVVNASGEAGLATRVSDSLRALGYVVDPPSSATPRARSEVVDESNGTAPRVIQQLRKDLGQPDLETVNGDPADSPEIVLELGEDLVDLRVAVPPDHLAPVSWIGPASGDGTSIPPPTPTSTPEPPPSPRPARATPTPAPVRLVGATPIRVAGNANLVVVPRLIGLPEAEAQRILVESGLQTTWVNYQTIDQVPDHAYFLSIPPGTVLSQSPPPGTEVWRGTRIALAVRKP